MQDDTGGVDHRAHGRGGPLAGLALHPGRKTRHLRLERGTVQPPRPDVPAQGVQTLAHQPGHQRPAVTGRRLAHLLAFQDGMDLGEDAQRRSARRPRRGAARRTPGNGS